VTLRAVPKPEGHDLNTRRADKEADASKWLPENALYDAYEQLIKGTPTGALVVAWYEKNEHGCLQFRMRQWNERTNDGIALAAEIFTSMVPRS
jgi:hypothetical protein